MSDLTKYIVEVEYRDEGKVQLEVNASDWDAADRFASKLAAAVGADWYDVERYRED